MATKATTTYTVTALAEPDAYSVQKDGVHAYSVRHYGRRFVCGCQAQAKWGHITCKHVSMVERFLAAETEREEDIRERWTTMDISEWATWQISEMERCGALW